MLQKSRVKVAVIIPIYDPPLNWEESCLEHMLALQALHPGYYFQYVLVNDGSPKNLFRRLKKLLKLTTVACQFHHLHRNYGKGKALRVGVQKFHASTPYFICVDWDFPFGVSIFKDIIQKLDDGYEVVLADRGGDYLAKLPLIRGHLTRLWRLFIRYVLPLKLPDTQGGLKVFSNNVKNLFTSCTTDSFFHDFEFILRCHMASVKITAVKVSLRGGVKLNNFPLSVYIREGRMFLKIIYSLYLNNKASH